MSSPTPEDAQSSSDPSAVSAPPTAWSLEEHLALRPDTVLVRSDFALCGTFAGVFEGPSSFYAAQLMSSPTPEDVQSPSDTSSLLAPPLSLKQHLNDKPYVDRRVLLQQVAGSLAFYHVVERVIHGDVKLTNVYVNDRGAAQLPKSRNTVPITALPRAPAYPDERLPATTATDVYAFAWLVFHAFTDIDPQGFCSHPNLMHRIFSGQKPNRPGPSMLPTRRGLNDRIWAMLVRCWEISPAARPPITEVIHAFDLPGRRYYGSTDSDSFGTTAGRRSGSRYD